MSRLLNLKNLKALKIEIYEILIYVKELSNDGTIRIDFENSKTQIVKS